MQSAPASLRRRTLHRSSRSGRRPGQGGIVAVFSYASSRPLPLRRFDAGRPNSGSEQDGRGVLREHLGDQLLELDQGGVGTSATPFSFARDFFSDPRWSMAAAAITPRLSDTAFSPASLPGSYSSTFVSLLRLLILKKAVSTTILRARRSRWTHG